MTITSSVNEEKNKASLNVTISKLEDYEEMRTALQQIRVIRAFTGKEDFGYIYKEFESKVDILLKEFEKHNQQLINEKQEAIMLNDSHRSAKSLVSMSILFSVLALIFYLTMDYLTIHSQFLFYLASISFFIAILIGLRDRRFLKIKKNKNAP
ncbi:hypothetical protein MLE16_004099 [Klebsiella oxytoca]|nr:hypothetical protein [Klebsiella oxytoca]